MYFQTISFFSHHIWGGRFSPMSTIIIILNYFLNKFNWLRKREVAIQVTFLFDVCFKFYEKIKQWRIRVVLGIYMSLLTHIKILFVEVYSRVPAKEVGLYGKSIPASLSEHFWLRLWIVCLTNFVMTQLDVFVVVVFVMFLLQFNAIQNIRINL